MNQSNNDINPLMYYPAMRNITGRDTYYKTDKAYYPAGIDRRRFQRKRDVFLGEVRKVKLTKEADEAIVSLAKEIGFDVSVLMREILIEWLERNNKIGKQ